MEGSYTDGQDEDPVHGDLEATELRHGRRPRSLEGQGGWAVEILTTGPN